MGWKERTKIIEKEERELPVQCGIFKPEEQVRMCLGVEGNDLGGERLWWVRLAGEIVHQVKQRS
jgi:hypothetical protein